MNTYSIVKIGVHGKESATGHTSNNYRACLYGLRCILSNYKDETPHGRKGENRRIDRNTIQVLNGGDLIEYKIVRN